MVRTPMLDLLRVSEIELLTVGRVNLDLYAQQTGVPFEEVTSWDAMVGGSPVNVAVAAARLSVASGVFTAVGADPVGDWVLRALKTEGVTTEFVARKRGPHTSLALRAQTPPDDPLAFYRHDPADIYLTEAEAEAISLEHVRALLVSADALARGSARQAALALLDRARSFETMVYLDLDLRHVNWPDLDTYAAEVAAAVELTDIVFGTEQEFAALLGCEPDADEGTLAPPLRDRLGLSSGRVVFLKRGARGATLFTGIHAVPLPVFRIVEASSVGAGDSFAAGVIASRLGGSDWPEAGRFGSACAAITASRYGCSRTFPKAHEVAALLEPGPLLAC
jgi:5-dehydro-2-deoxygluconokinase